MGQLIHNSMVVIRKTVSSTVSALLCCRPNKYSTRTKRSVSAALLAPSCIWICSRIYQSNKTVKTYSLISDNGQVYHWGYGPACGSNDNIFTPTRVDGLERIIKVAAGDSHSVALSADGKIFAWGSNEKVPLCTFLYHI